MKSAIFLILVSILFVWDVSGIRGDVTRRDQEDAALDAANQSVHGHGRTGRCVVLAISTWATWFCQNFSAAQGRLLTKKKEEKKGEKGPL